MPNWCYNEGECGMTRHRLETGESLQDYIERRIDEMFNDLAEELGDIHTNDADTAAAIPFELLIKCEKLKAAWREMITEDTKVGNAGGVR